LKREFLTIKSQKEIILNEMMSDRETEEFVETKQHEHNSEEAVLHDRKSDDVNSPKIHVEPIKSEKPDSRCQTPRAGAHLTQTQSQSKIKNSKRAAAFHVSDEYLEEVHQNLKRHDLFWKGIDSLMAIQSKAKINEERYRKALQAAKNKEKTARRDIEVSHLLIT
jgi:hypothetical protein